MRVSSIALALDQSGLVPSGPPVTTNFSQAQAITGTSGIGTDGGFIGFFDKTTLVSTHFWSFRADFSFFVCYIHGTDASMLVNCGGAGANPAAPFWVSVDGAEPTAPNMSAKPSGTIVLFAGLADTLHLVVVSSAAAYNGGNANVSTTAANLFTITSTAPAISMGPDLGPFYLCRDPSNPFKDVHLTHAGPVSAGYTPNQRYSGVQPAGITAMTQALYSGGTGIRTNGSTIWALTGETAGRVSIDKARGVRAPLSGPSVFTFRSLKKVASGLDTSTTHDYIVATAQSAAQIAATPDSGCLGFMVGPSTATIGTHPGLLGASFGDSRTYAAMASGSAVAPSTTIPPVQYTCGCDGVISSMLAGAIECAVGTAGKQIADLNTDGAVLLAALPASLDYIVTRMGYNDTAGGTFQTAYQTWLTTLRTAYPSAKLFARSVMKGATGAAVDANISAAVAARVIAGDNNVFFWDGSTFDVTKLETNEQYALGAGSGPINGTGAVTAGYGPNWGGQTHPTDNPGPNGNGTSYGGYPWMALYNNANFYTATYGF